MRAACHEGGVLANHGRLRACRTPGVVLVFAIAFLGRHIKFLNQTATLCLVCCCALAHHILSSTPPGGNLLFGNWIVRVVCGRR